MKIALRVGFLFLIFLIVTINVEIVLATGIAGPPKSERQFYFSPGLVKTFTFHLQNAEAIYAYTEGDLTEYTELVDDSPGSGPRDIQIVIRLPQDLEPGVYVLYVGARESAPGGGTMGAIAAVRTKITVTSLEREPYLTASVSASDTAVDEETYIILSLQSLTRVDMPDVDSEIRIYDSEGNVIDKMQIEDVSIPSGEGKTISKIYNVSGLSEGEYKVNATVQYSGIHLV